MEKLNSNHFSWNQLYSYNSISSEISIKVKAKQGYLVIVHVAQKVTIMVCKTLHIIFFFETSVFLRGLINRSDVKL